MRAPFVNATARLLCMLVDAVWYDEGRHRGAGALAELAAARADAGRGFVWAGMHDPTPAEIAAVADVFDLHPLAVEDARQAARQRPKVERYGEWLFIAVRSSRYIDESEEIQFGEIQIFARDDAVVVLRNGEPVPLARVRTLLEDDPKLLAAGSVAVVHGVLDAVVDAFQDCLSGLDDDVSEIELDVFADHRSRDGHQLAERIYFLHREVLELHRAVQPLAEALAHLRSDPLVGGASGWDEYFRDIDDHLRREQDQLIVLRELLATALAANGTQISISQNEDMRRISAWVAIVAVPTMVAGIYGMNFEHMPELDWVAGYPVALGVMIVVCTVLFTLFRRSGWL